MKVDVTERRVEHLRRYDVTAARHSHDLQALVDLAAQACGREGAAITLHTSTRPYQIATCGPIAAPPMAPSSSEACRSSAPLVAPDGVVVGELTVFDSVPHQLSDQQERLLGFLADRTIDIFELRATSRDLAASLEALTRSRDELRRSNELLSAFAGQISHDLRTPLTAMMASSELLSRDPLIAGDPNVEPLVRTTLQAAQRMARMIDQILAHAAVGAQLECADVDLDTVLGSVLQDLTPILRESGARVEPGDLPTVSADAQQLYPVLLNLVANAVKFARPGVPPRIRITAQRRGGCWRVTVSDNGIGIPPRQRAAVFNLFHRANTLVDGQGIGLATVKRVVEAHGGTVGIDDPPAGDSGTAVWFQLPA